MGFFAWLNSSVNTLLDQMVDWLGEKVSWFIESLIKAVSKVWNTVIATTLYAAFGAVNTLYVIFYAGSKSGETIMEAWDPDYYNTKPSQVFKLRQVPTQSSPLPTQRDEAKILVLEN